jgi:hypothetical protein
MDKTLAKNLMDQFVALGEPLNTATELTEKIADAQEREAVRRGLGNIMGLVYTDLMMPLIERFPDLDPDKK